MNYNIITALSFALILITINTHSVSAYGGMCSNSGENYTQMKKCMVDFKAMQTMNSDVDKLFEKNHLATQKMIKRYQILDNANATAKWDLSKAKLAGMMTKNDVISRHWYDQMMSEHKQTILQFLHEYKTTNKYRDYAYQK